MSRSFEMPGRSPVMANNAMVATSHPLASTTALSILREGGNAVDAAIAASITLCVVEPQMTGIGGDCFAILCEPDGSIHGVNGSGRAAKNARIDWYLENNFKSIEETSAHSVTVPGALRAWEMLHTKFGSMDWVRLFADGINLATNGYAVAPRVAFDWAKAHEKLNKNPSAKKHFLFDNKAPHSGQLIKLPALGESLKKIAIQGASAFYEGEIAEEITSTIQNLGGFLTPDDFHQCKSDWVTPISTKYKDHEILEIPPNGQGLTALVLLNLLSEINSNHPCQSANRYHESMEFGRIAYAMRDTYISDPAFMDTKVTKLLSKQKTIELLKQYNPAMRNNAIKHPKPPNADTIYLSIVDKDQRAISFINSIYSSFGSGIVTEKSGITLQNRGSCFTVDKNHCNTIDSEKRPLHTIIPAMALKNKKPAYSFGVMGGAYQPIGHAHVLENMLKYDMDPQQAIDFPRCFWNDDGHLVVENTMEKSAINQLANMGHTILMNGLHGGSQIIKIDQNNGVLIGGSDPRKDGHACGY